MKKTFYLSCLGILLSCNTDQDTFSVENNVVGPNNFEVLSVDIPLQINNLAVNEVQTNSQTHFVLGELSQGDFGKTNAKIVSQIYLPQSVVFGNFSQEKETTEYDENENVDKVYLYLPFFSKSTQENASAEKTYTLDSIFGSKNADFTLKVDELDYFLSSIDASLQPKAYFSSENLPMGQNLASKPAKISEREIVRHKFDDPTTSEDESTAEKDRLSPGIRIELDKDYFQNKIMVKEGDDVLASNINFTNHIKGIVISADNLSAEFLSYIDISKAKIEVEYSFQHKHTDNNFYTKKSSVEFPLSGQIFSLYETSNQSISLSDQNIFLKGGNGYTANIILDSGVLSSLKAENVLITGADLFLYVDESKNVGDKKANFILPYVSESGNLLRDYASDLSYNNNNILSVSKLLTDELGSYYKLKIVDFLNTALKTSTQISFDLSSTLMVQDFVLNDRNQQVNRAFSTSKYKDSSSLNKKMLSAHSQNLFGMALHGSASTEIQKRPKLRVFYTKAK